MRVRLGALLVVCALALTGCGSDDKKDDAKAGSDSTSAAADPTPSVDASDPATGEVDCVKFQAAAAKAAEIQSQLGSGADVSGQLEASNAALEELKAGAPENVVQALTDLQEAFSTYAELMKNPMAADQTKLAEMGAKISSSAQTVGAYVSTACAS